MKNGVMDLLAKTYLVKDIMTPFHKLERADELERAKVLQEEYDVIPFPEQGLIQGYYERGRNFTQEVDPTNLISDSTGILSLPLLLNQNHFYFIIHRNEIVGYIHYSDMNKLITKIPFFAVYQYIETKIWNKIGEQITEEKLYEIFPDNNVKSKLNKKKKREKENVYLGNRWSGLFFFPEMLKIARSYKIVNLSNEDIVELGEFRNRAAHGDRVLLESFDDISRIFRFTKNQKFALKYFCLNCERCIISEYYH